MTLKDGTVIIDPAALVREIPFKTWVYREAESLNATAKALYNRIYDGSYAMPKRRKVNSRVILVPDTERAVKISLSRTISPCGGISRTNRALYAREWRNWRRALANLWEQAAMGQFGTNAPACKSAPSRNE